MCNWDSSINTEELTIVRLAKVAGSLGDLRILPISFTKKYSNRTLLPIYSSLLQAMNAELVVAQVIVILSPTITFCRRSLGVNLMRGRVPLPASSANPVASKENKTKLH